MNKYSIVELSIMASLALTLSSLSAIAHDYAKKDLVIDHPWARPTHSAVVPAAVYFEIVNKGAENDRLLSASTERAKHVELHKTEISDEGVARMSMLKEGIVATANEKTSMETGAYHVMLIGLDARLQAGEKFPMTLTFEKSGDIEVIINVEDRQSKAKDRVDHTGH